MSQDQSDILNRELVIIRRRAHVEADVHKGGVWKIAYADFMTAMMAFFLVMWLINAANEETRTQVASYFNPVRLVDSRTSMKGLQDLDTGADSTKAREAGAVKAKTDQKEASSEDKKKITEEMLFREPFATLRQIAGPAEEDKKVQDPKMGSLPETANRPGKLGGKAYLDPFDPQTWQRVASKKVEAEAASVPAGAGGQKVEKPADDAAARQSAQAQKATEVRPETQEDPKGRARAEDGRKEARQIEKEIADALGTKAPGASPRIEVRSTENGVLISLTDDASFGMFAIASAEPQPVLVTYVEKIGKILNARPGRIIISGHTDGRPFRSDVYDNWRLSTARAHMAYYMLVRGGIDAKRVERIEGHADRDLKVPGDPEAAENRRIEILLHEVKS